MLIAQLALTCSASIKTSVTVGFLRLRLRDINKFTTLLNTFSKRYSVEPKDAHAILELILSDCKGINGTAVEFVNCYRTNLDKSFDANLLHTVVGLYGVPRKFFESYGTFMPEADVYRIKYELLKSFSAFNFCSILVNSSSLALQSRPVQVCQEPGPNKDKSTGVIFLPVRAKLVLKQLAMRCPQTGGAKRQSSSQAILMPGRQ
ncbi:hypothetical protein GQX74_005126 [Glossina fuscipes]|nr:hypothetical protein GQX74_005126 [Glossina fuscipes]